MSPVATRPEMMVDRQPFARWAIAIPPTFAETFVADGCYWHAWDERRSVSLSSVAISDRRGRPVRAGQILKRFPGFRGERVAVPEGLDGWAVIDAPPQPAIASRAISGMLAVDGGVLIATVTSDDLSWANTVWLSIRYV